MIGAVALAALALVPAPPAAAYARRPAAVWVRHLNCATNAPWLGGPTVCHCLLVGTPRALVLVDTGLGTRDVASPGGRFLAPYLWLIRPRLDPAETAAAQLARAGFRPDDVTDVVVTHLDLDHTGGLADFPRARVHLLGAELGRRWADPRIGALARLRWEHGARWSAHDAAPGGWLGMPAARLPIAGADLRLVPLPGHSPGHAGVAVRDGRRWLFHAGDAYFHPGELATPPATPPAVRLFHALRGEDAPAARRTLARLRRLVAGGHVTVFSAHDAAEFEAAILPERRIRGLGAFVR